MAGRETRTTERESFIRNQEQTPHGKKYGHTAHVYSTVIHTLSHFLSLFLFYFFILLDEDLLDDIKKQRDQFDDNQRLRDEVIN